MKITVMTLFPEFFDSFQATSIISRALQREQVVFETVDFRQYTTDKHNHVDDTPCGGGQGMLLSCQPIVDCLKAIRSEESYVVMLTPEGQTFTQSLARQYAQNISHLILLCGHYEGFDERIHAYVDAKVSLGDFVLTGGEPVAIVICDAIIRLLQGVIQEESHQEDSFENGLLEYPQYTRPVEYDGQCVPEVLLSGHHANIRRWRLKQSLLRTLQYRPDLLENRVFSKEEETLMKEIENER